MSDLQPYTYVLRSPISSIPIYVGKGVGDRSYKHRQQNSPIGAHVRSLVSQGLTPTYQKIPVNNADEAFELEALLIDEIGRLENGTGTLFNMRPGGRKVVQAESSKQKMSAAKIGKPLSAAHKESISETLKGRKPSVESCKRQSIIMKEWWAMRKLNKAEK